LKGVRENEARMRALGYAVWHYKYFASIVAAFFAGVAGELFVYLNGFVSPSALSVTVSAQVLIMVLVGAAGTLFGPMLGAVLFVLLQYVVSTYTERWLFVIGIMYVIIALYAPQGALTFLWAWWRRRTRSVAWTRSWSAIFRTPSGECERSMAYRCNSNPAKDAPSSEPPAPERPRSSMSSTGRLRRVPAKSGF